MRPEGGGVGWPALRRLAYEALIYATWAGLFVVLLVALEGISGGAA